MNIHANGRTTSAPRVNWNPVEKFNKGVSKLKGSATSKRNNEDWLKNFIG